MTLWSGRIDPVQPGEDPKLAHRVHQRIQKLDLTTQLSTQHKKSVALLGFKSDLGVIRNQGRPGAAEAPDSIRKAMANAAWHFGELQLFDAGNIIIPTEGTATPQNDTPLTATPHSPDPLQQAQNLLAKQVTRLQQAGYFTLILGGGHEIAKPHYLGIKCSDRTKRVGIVNIDAHLDLRINPIPTSGTSFYEIYQSQTQQNEPFDYAVLGLQKFSNTAELYRIASLTNTKILHAEEFNQTNLTATHPAPIEFNPTSPASNHPIQTHFPTPIQSFLNEYLSNLDKVYLTTCMDVVDAAYAPGVSAPATHGLTPYWIHYIYWVLAQSGKLVGADIAETNPGFDSDNRTLKLAARFALEILDAIKKEKP